MSRPPHARNVIVCGSYRSGTTWLMEILSAGLDTQFDFEPLEPSVNPAVAAARLRNRYLSPERTYEALDPLLEGILRGRFVHPYTKGMGMHPFYYHRWKFWARRHVIKMVQGHMLLGYVQRRFDFPWIVLLVRNPFEVVASLKRQAWWRSDLEEFLDERSADLFSDYPRLEDCVRQASALLDAERLHGLMRKIGETAIRYCIENYVPLRQQACGQCRFRILRYEELRGDPAGRAAELCRWLGIPFTRSRSRRTARWSRTASQGPGKLSAPTGADTRLPAGERELMERILDVFRWDTVLREALQKPLPGSPAAGPGSAA